MTAKKSSKRQAKIKRPAGTVRTPKKKDHLAGTARPIKKVRRANPLTHSNAEAEREISKLRAYREQLQSDPSLGEGDARASLI